VSVRKTDTEKSTNKTIRNGVTTHEDSSETVTNYALRPYTDDEGKITGYDYYGQEASSTKKESRTNSTESGELTEKKNIVTESSKTYFEDGVEKTSTSTTTTNDEKNGSVTVSTNTTTNTRQDVEYKDDEDKTVKTAVRKSTTTKSTSKTTKDGVVTDESSSEQQTIMTRSLILTAKAKLQDIIITAQKLPQPRRAAIPAKRMKET
jgi:hypothetical protein